PRDQLETCQETNWRPAKREMNCFIPLSALSHSVKDGCTSLELFTDRCHWLYAALSIMSFV
ncbi:MAG: hypothetical protein ACRDDA_08950, partial [Aeromonas sp.]